MPMQVIEGGVIKVAIIDPSKKFGEDGQYQSFTVDTSEVVEEALVTGKEVRWYYTGLKTNDDEPVATQVIITAIPPKHVQPFHTHNTLHEMTLVEEGEVYAVDSDDLSESSNLSLLSANGRLLEKGDMVIEGPGTRHTIVNASDKYARLVTIQTARMSIEEFPHDWERDK